jgi:hypothetical protein
MKSVIKTSKDMFAFVSSVVNSSPAVPVIDLGAAIMYPDEEREGDFVMVDAAEAVAASIGQVNQGLTKVKIEEDSEEEDEEDNDFFISESDMPALSAESIEIGVNYLGKLATIREEDSEGSDSEEEEPEDNSLRLSAVD